jgi:glucose PTS system EIICB or EIICBA component
VVGTSVQAVFGPLSEGLKNDMQEYLASPGADATLAPHVPKAPAPQAALVAPEATIDPAALLPSLGGKANVRTLQALALTRLRVELADGAVFDEAAARKAGVLGVMRISPKVLHLIVGAQAPTLAAALA